MTNMTGSKLSICSHPGKITGYWITTRSFPYRGQCGCLFSRCRKYVINSLIHGHFHIGLVIIPRPILALDYVSGQYGGLGMITRLIWKCPCINLYIYYKQFVNVTYHRLSVAFCVGIIFIQINIFPMVWLLYTVQPV